VELYLIPFVLEMDDPSADQVLDTINPVQDVIHNTRQYTGMDGAFQSVSRWGDLIVATMFLVDYGDGEVEVHVSRVVEASLDATRDRCPGVRLMTKEESDGLASQG